MKNSRMLKFFIAMTILFVLFIATFSILGLKERTGYISDFNTYIKKGFVAKDGEYAYHARIKYNSKTFRNNDIYGVYPSTNNIPSYITSVEFDYPGSPYSKVISTKEIKSDDSFNIQYKLRVKNVFYLYLSLFFIYIAVIYFFQKKSNTYIFVSLLSMFTITYCILKSYYTGISPTIIYSASINFLVWVYALFISYLIGSLTLNVIERIVKVKMIDSLFLVCFVGFVSLLGVLQLVAIFTRLWIGTFISINVISILLLFIDFNTNKKRFMLVLNNVNNLFSSPVFLFLSIIIAFKFLYYSALIPENWDMAYHVQTIRWLEECGTVFGLGNVSGRLVFGSSWLLLDTFFGMSYIFKSPIHAVYNFIVFIFFLFCIENITFKIKKNYLLSIFALFISVFTIFEFYVVYFNSGTDTIANLYYVIVIMLWMKAFLDKEKRILYFILIVYLSAFTVTAKTSMIPIALLSLFSFIYILISKIRNKRAVIFTIVVLGLFISLPFLARNVIQSGYLIYPYPSINIFNVDWKIPLEEVTDMKNIIVRWGRVPGQIPVEEYRVSEWLPLWLARISEYNSFFNLKLIHFYFISVLLMFFSFIFSIIKRKKINTNLSYSLTTYPIFILSIVSISFWFFTAPEYRFAFSFWIVLLAISFSILLSPNINKFKKIIPKKLVVKNDIHINTKHIFFAFSILILLCMSFISITHNKLEYNKYRYIEVVRIKHKNIGYYYIPNDGQGEGGYYNFPASSVNGVSDKVYLRGNDIKDGFKYVDDK